MTTYTLPPHAIDTRARRLGEIVRELHTLDADKGFTVEIREESRTVQQNRWLWRCYGWISDHAAAHFGETVSPMALHEWAKRRWLNCTTEIVAGDVVEIWPSTTKLTKREFGDYFERLAQWCSEDLSLVIPEPDWHWKIRAKAPETA